MSFRRETYDGNGVGRSPGSKERGNPFGNKDAIDKYAVSKRPGKNFKRRLKSEENPFTEEGDRDRYIITYSDLITLLLGLFILLYASSNVDEGKYTKVVTAFGTLFGSGNPMGMLGTGMLPANEKAFKSLNEQLTDIVKDNNLDSSVKLIQNDRGVTIRILDDILFSSGSATLNDYSKVILKKLAEVIKKIPNDIRIEGHTDNIPISSGAFPSNWHLSVARATNTAYYLMNDENVSQARVSVVGYAEFQPVDSNETPQGRANNRRVDIVILK